MLARAVCLVGITHIDYQQIVEDPVSGNVSSATEIRTYRTADGKEIVFEGDHLLIRTSAEYFEVGVSTEVGDLIRGTFATDRLQAGVLETLEESYMQIHVPGLSILVAELRKVDGSDAYRLSGIDDLFPGLSEQLFERTDATTFISDYQPLPDFVPTTAFLAKLPSEDVEYILVIREFKTGQWYVFSLDDGFYGGLCYVPRIESAGIAGVSFEVDGHHYELVSRLFDNTGPHYTRDDQPMEYIDAEKFHIDVAQINPRMAYVQLIPLDHAQH